MDFLLTAMFSFNGPGRTLKIDTGGKLIEIPFLEHLKRHEVNTIKAIPLPALEHLNRQQRKALHEVSTKEHGLFRG